LNVSSVCSVIILWETISWRLMDDLSAKTAAKPRIFKLKDFNKRRSKIICASCTKPIQGEWMEALHSAYHLECFSCCVCAKRIEAGNFKMKDEKHVVCLSCSKNLCKKPCQACKQQIIGSFITSLGKNWHKKCLKCFFCNNSLQHFKLYHKEGNICCSNCIQGEPVANIGTLENPLTSLVGLLQNQQTLPFYKKFLQKQFCLENVLFWQDVELYKKAKDHELEGLSRSIYQKYLVLGSELEININSIIRLACFFFKLKEQR
jgi:hypothetical protein